MAEENVATGQNGRRAVWFSVLLLLDSFVLGGVTVLVLVNQLLNTTMSSMNESIPGDAFGVIPHVQDRLLYYWVGYLGIAVLLILVTYGAYMWLAIRSARRSREKVPA